MYLTMLVVRCKIGFIVQSNKCLVSRHIHANEEETYSKINNLIGAIHIEHISQLDKRSNKKENPEPQVIYKICSFIFVSIYKSCLNTRATDVNT